jgi:hypothetical protein
MIEEADMSSDVRRPTRQAGGPSGSHGAPGFALIIAIMSLLLLTFLGLTLAATTTTELQVAANYRWSQQALYNAEAGIEAGKFILKTIPNDWSKILPPVRPGTWAPDGTAPNPVPPVPAPWVGIDNWKIPARNWENAGCDRQTGEGMGAVLNDALAAPLIIGAPAGPYQNVTTFLGQQLNGSFTLWVSRVILTNAAGQLQDDPDPTPSRLVLTAEGTAPYVNFGDATNPASQTLFTQTNRAVQYLRVALARSPQAPSCGGKNSGQKGGAPSGANFSTCGRLGPGSLASFTGFAGAGNLQDTGVQ